MTTIRADSKHCRDSIEAHEAKLRESGRAIQHISYGTAGFRGKSNQIEHLFFRCGIVTSLRLYYCKKNIGIMITASHNPIQDNGVKLIDPSGDMLESDWEQIVEKFCNLSSQEQIIEEINSLSGRFNLSESDKHYVLLAHDTRPSSSKLASLVEQGIKALDNPPNIHLYGLLTTPALHYLVATSNAIRDDMPKPEEYYAHLKTAYVDLIEHLGLDKETSDRMPLCIDLANGVGYITMENFQKDPKFCETLPFSLINGDDLNALNKDCGADFVKTTGRPPSGATSVTKRYASIDGDADRVVYFYLEETTGQDELKLNLLDGDKIMTLIAIYLKEALKSNQLDTELSLGLVQTAYANGASTEYMSKTLGTKVDIVDTGVKNLHKRATAYDLGVYFEANGHGSVWMSTKAVDRIERLVDDKLGLKYVLNIVNKYIGDAISDILVVESILRIKKWTIKDWHQTYTDRPNVLTKVVIPDRSAIETTDAGQRCTKPVGLQDQIDGLVGRSGEGCRCFVRPSGTENVVRIYAEAGSKALAEKLAQDVGAVIRATFGN